MPEAVLNTWNRVLPSRASLRHLVQPSAKYSLQGTGETLSTALLAAGQYTGTWRLKDTGKRSFIIVLEEMAAMRMGADGQSPGSNRSALCPCKCSRNDPSWCRL